ncbi:hypothetical protein P7K49_026624 [Saguinus oedipus]|uniref:sphingomyelin phosphodiesterase n=1 Tax=Saguinus oedipus TaxID=9490 RepID=A0ABQ9UDR0_SAGOE|nr:hypothetical protein P7K49_026624 [Saguinus oedipus]
MWRPFPNTSKAIPQALETLRGDKGRLHPLQELRGTSRMRRQPRGHSQCTEGRWGAGKGLWKVQEAEGASQDGPQSLGRKTHAVWESPEGPQPLSKTGASPRAGRSSDTAGLQRDAQWVGWILPYGQPVCAAYSVLTCVGPSTGESDAAHTAPHLRCAARTQERSPSTWRWLQRIPLVSGGAQRIPVRPSQSACTLEANESPRAPRPYHAILARQAPGLPAPCGPRPSRTLRCTSSTAWPARCSSRPTGPWISYWAAAAAGRPAPGAARPAALAVGAANLCLLRDGLALFSNLPHSQRRVEAIGAALLAGLRPALYRATDCNQPWPRAPRGALVASLPVGLDFVCLQEVFDLRAARRLVNRLAPNLDPVLYDVGTFGLQPGPHLKLPGSGLLLASRYPLLRAAFRCFPHARGEDALASKGLLLLSAQAQLGSLDGRRIVGFLHCTHLSCRSVAVAAAAADPYLCLHPARHLAAFVYCPGNRIPEKCLSGLTHQELGRRGLDAGSNRSQAHPTTLPTAEDGPLRSKQLTLLLDWAKQFEAQRDQSGEVAAFSVLLGDLHFDNCSKDHILEQEQEFFSRFPDPCRLGTRQEQPWALGIALVGRVPEREVDLRSAVGSG